MRTFFLSLIFLSVIVCTAAGIWYWSFLNTPTAGEAPVIIVVPKGAGVRQIASILAEHGLVRGELPFLVLVRLVKTGAAMQAGEYSIARGLKPEQVLEVLTRGEVLQHRLTIPEGLTLKQIGQLFAEAGWVDLDHFVAMAKDPGYAAKLGLEALNLEGYLFPDTYTLVREEKNAAFILSIMVKRFFTVWEELAADAENTLSRHQVVTMASIVEKETGAARERPLIAGVFLNRLQQGMRLQSDPTVIYGVDSYNGNITRKDLRRKTPYNTYVIKGLPPGPICNPGREAIGAVLRPEKTRALYFVSRNDGTHVFSNSLAEHNRAVRKYQRQKKN